MSTMSGTCFGAYLVRFHREPGAQMSDPHDGRAIAFRTAIMAGAGTFCSRERESREGGHSLSWLEYEEKERGS